jgi:hypothetical protein
MLEYEPPPPKRMKVMIGVNTLTSVSREVYSNHMQFYFRFGRSMQDFDFILNNPSRMSIDAMRNMTAKTALANDCDYLVFIDDDVCVPIDFLSRLIMSGADIAAGWTVIRGYPFKNMIFRFIDEEHRQLQHWDENDFPENVPNGWLACDAVGFSCVLIKCDLLRKVDPPYFVTGPYNTEDIYFCLKAKETVPECRIITDIHVKTSHCLGNEFIDPLNKILYKKYVEDLNPALLGQKEEPDTSKKQDTQEENETSYEEVLKDAIFKK